MRDQHYGIIILGMISMLQHSNTQPDQQLRNTHTHTHTHREREREREIERERDRERERER